VLRDAAVVEMDGEKQMLELKLEEMVEVAG